MMNFYSYCKQWLLSFSTDSASGQLPFLQKKPLLFNSKGYKKGRQFMLLLPFFCLISFSGFSQSPTDNWLAVSSQDGVEAFYKFETCENGQVLLLKFSNSNLSGKDIKWVVQLKSPSGEIFPFPEGEILKVEGSSSAIGSCAGEIESLTKPVSEKFNNASVYLSFSIVD